MCLVLYWTKFGMYTKTELDTAYNERCAGNNPRRLYVYFKDGGELPEDLKDFRDSFINNYGHFFCHFENIDTLKADFLLQFMDYQSKELGVKSSIEISNGNVIIGKEYVELTNVPFAGNNEEYNLLLKSIKKTRRLISVTDEDDPEYAEYKEELKDLEKKLSTMESNLWEQALLITRLSTSRCSERLERAMSLFNRGDNKGALAVLDEEAIEKDARHNINLLKLADEGRRGLEINIKELEMRIASLECNIAPLDDRTEIVELRKKILEWTEALYGGDSVQVADRLMDLSRAFGLGIIDSQYYQEPIQYALKSLRLYKQHYGDGHLSVSDVYTYLGDLQTQVRFTDDNANPMEYYSNAHEIRIKELGENHELVAEVYYKIAMYYSLFSREYDTVIEYSNKALQIYQNTIGENDVRVSDTYRTLWHIYEKKRDASKAVECALKTLAIRESVLGKFNEKTVDTLYVIYRLFREIGDEENTLKYGIRYGEYWQNIAGDDDPKLTDALTDMCIQLGLHYFVSGDYLSSVSYLQKAAERGSAYAYNLLSYAYFRLDEIKKAFDAIDMAIAMDPLCPNYIDSKGEHLLNMGKEDEALECWKQVLRLDPEFLEKNESDLYSSLKEKGLVE